MENLKNTKYLKEVEQILTKHLNSYSDKDLNILRLEEDLTKISKRYDEMKAKMEEAINNTVNSKTRQYEQLVKEQGTQLSKMLFENNKLRQYIEKVSGQIMLPMHPDMTNEGNLSTADQKLYANDTELVKINRDLKKEIISLKNEVKVLLKEQSSSSTTEGGSQQDINSLMKKLEASNQELNKAKEQRDISEKKADNTHKENRELKSSLRALQNEHNIHDQNFKNSEEMVRRLKAQVSVINPSISVDSPLILA